MLTLPRSSLTMPNKLDLPLWAIPIQGITGIVAKRDTYPGNALKRNTLLADTVVVVMVVVTVEVVEDTVVVVDVAKDVVIGMEMLMKQSQNLCQHLCGTGSRKIVVSLMNK